jgi:hypothetical protein
MKRILTLLVLTCTGAGLLAQTHPARDAKDQASPSPSTAPTTKPARLLRITKDGKIGFIDTAGHVVIGPKFSADMHMYDMVGEFREGLAQVCIAREGQSRRWGYIDRTGEFVIPERFEYAGEFSEGLAPVLIGGKCGFINHKGEVVIDPKYECAWEFSEGLAMFQVAKKSGPDEYGVIKKSGPDEYGFIDAKGEVVIAPQAFDVASHKFVEGMLCFRKGEKFGCMDKTGKVVIEPKFLYGCGFSEGLAATFLEPKKMGFIDKTGAWAIEPKFIFGGFSEGLAAARPSGTSPFSGYIDKTGKMVIAPTFFQAGPFHEGLARVALLPEGPGYVDTFSVVSVPLNGKFKFGYIDKSGKLVIPYTWDEVEDFADGVARVHVDDKIGYIDHQGKYIWEPSR